MTTREFLVFFARHHLYFNMRFQEFEALASLCGAARDREDLYVEKPAPTALVESPFSLVRLPSEGVARELCKRAVLIKLIVEVWDTAASASDAVASLLARGVSACESRRVWLAPPNAVCVRVAAFGKTLSMESKGETLEVLRPLFRGDELIDLKNPSTVLWVLEEHATHYAVGHCAAGHGAAGDAAVVRRVAGDGAAGDCAPGDGVAGDCAAVDGVAGDCAAVDGVKGGGLGRPGGVLRTFVGRQVAGGRSCDKRLQSGDKAFFHRYDLSQRCVLGPTTTENELAFIMANCAQATAAQVAFDPFCGSGGILLALAHFGALTVGGEIDTRILRGWRLAYIKNWQAAVECGRAKGRTGGREDEDGRGREETGDTTPQPGSKGEPTSRNIFTNFLQYGLTPPEPLVCDSAQLPFRAIAGGWCDCVVTDPPYGVRAGAWIGARAGPRIRDGEQGLGLEPIDPNGDLPHVSHRGGYLDSDLSRDLLETAATILKDNGRLVYLAPVDLADFLGIVRESCVNSKHTKLHNILLPKGPKGVRKDKDPRLFVTETSRDPRLLDERAYAEYLPKHESMELIGASLQILSGGVGRLLVTMRRKLRDE